ncbi:MAG: amidohydrolase/deacetylase family metallohydrolase [Bryobacteraceae bacterium]
MFTPFDLVFRNGHVIDPAQDLDGIADVGIRDGRIESVGPALDVTGCDDVRDAAGTYLCPGLVDLHGHWYEGGLYGINAEIGLNHGVTTAVDAGTSGFANFPEFRRATIQTSRARILAFVHVSFMGLHGPFAEELVDLRYARPLETAIVAAENRDVAVGVKVRLGAMTADHGNQALDLAIEAAREAGMPVMAHVSAGADERYVLDHLRPGDILTHCFHGRTNRMVADTPDGFIPELNLARERGVIFDIGHGCGSFAWETAQRAFEHHFWPDTISTDLHRYSVDSPWLVTMPQVMSKFLCLGMSLKDVIAKSTIAPANVLGRGGEFGSLRVGSAADLLQFRVRNGSFTFTDTHRLPRIGERLIEPLLTVRKGVVYEPGSICVPLRPVYPCDRAVFDNA